MTGNRSGLSAPAGAWAAAAALIEGGRAGEAEAALRRDVARVGPDPELLLLLSVSLLRQARPAEALPILDRLVGHVRRSDIFINRGQALLDLGRPDQAESSFSEAARLSPEIWQAAYLLGIARERNGDHAGAAKAFGRVLALDATIWDARLRLMAALRLAGRFDDAAAAASAALAYRPDDIAVGHDLAMLLALAGRPGEALQEVDRVLHRAPEFVEALNTRGNVLGDLKRADESDSHYRRAMALAPAFADGHYNLANRDRQADVNQSAEQRYRRAIAIAPEHVNARNNLATTLLAEGRADEAIAAYETCLRQAPGWADATFNLGMAQLLKGDMARGLIGYESRWQVGAFQGVRRNFPQPLWDGSPFEDRSLLVHAEQGAGDTIQFARYVPLICARGGAVVLDCPVSLARLLASLDGGARLIRWGEPLPPFDMHLPLGSAMRVFGTEIETIPAMVPYLKADAADRERWRRRLAGDGLKIGVTWQGNPDQGAEPHRSIPLKVLHPLLQVSGCRFFALQKEFGRDQMADLPHGALADLGPELTDFAETAAIISELDLVISTCTSVVHLAGALGKPVWVLLRLSPDWRWLLGRDDSPWYPTARLFRQERPGDWTGVVARAGDALRRWPGP